MSVMRAKSNITESIRLEKNLKVIESSHKYPTVLSVSCKGMVSAAGNDYPVATASYLP